MSLGEIEVGKLFLTEPQIETRGRKRKWFADRPATNRETAKYSKQKKSDIRKDHIAILDMESDPFDNKKPHEKIYPFAACLYSHKFEPIVIWENDYETFVQKLLLEIEALPGAFTIYAHNGGKFDYMFLLHKMRGKISFKGRGIMCAKIGPHELRDSFHIIPEKLANYKKDDFDYNKMKRNRRDKHRDEITRYLVNDCKYLLEIVRGFVDKFGLKISIGQAAMAQLKQHYKVGTIGENTDASLREYFFGGRVQCLAGRGYFKGEYKLYDVNSMYPYVMAEYQHPIASNYTLRRKGDITDKTVFLELRCTNDNALVARNDEGETTAQVKRGTFKTTIWEFNAAQELGLIENVDVTGFIDNDERSNFADFVVPLYNNRLDTKARLKTLAEGSLEYNEAKKDDIFYKLLLNNAYGKFAQNPRRFKEYEITGPGEKPATGYDEQLFPAIEAPDYNIWSKPILSRRYNNVGTAASITGAARAVLLKAIYSAVDPIYCDTDSLICKRLDNHELDTKKLGAWDLEAEFSEVIINGKKLYACKPANWNGQEKSIKIKSKGASGISWKEMQAMLDGAIIEKMNTGVTITKTGNQFYMSRNIRATTPIRSTPTVLQRLRA